MMMGKWICDRMPTFDDADDDGDVYTPGGVMQPWHCIVDDELWYPLPKQPKTQMQLIEELLECIDQMNDQRCNWSDVWEAREKLR